MTADPLVTVAVPTFSRFSYLREAVASALGQTYPRVEVLVGDDGTSEEIRAWGEAEARRDPRVRYRRNPRNLGLAGNWNALADDARGDFLAVIGDDDRLLPDFAARLAGALRAGHDVAFANHHLIDADGARLAGKTLRHTAAFHRDRLPPGPLADAAACVWRNSVPMSAALVRTDLVRRLRFKEDLNTPEIELFARLAAAGGRFFFVPDYLAEYRDHAGSATGSGLRSEALAPYLAALDVPPAVEPLKRALLGPMLLDGVKRCLLRGDAARARTLASNPYFAASGARRAGNGRLQRLCLGLPGPLGCALYRGAYRARALLLRARTSPAPGDA
jgi:glycosyltransferase involved in cell wall biosynthesis